ncbi:MAG: DUF4282 domain-containing protein [Caulobacteraceae bacterium]|nr:DUF4282 domain-containing protein [Caulobacter sp.]
MRARTQRRGRLLDALTLDRSMGLAATQLIYWGGLAVVALVAFGVVGGAVGLMIRSGFPDGVLIGVPVLVAGLALAAVLGLLWRGACEFFVAVFQIADDLRALRAMSEAQGGEAEGMR